MRYLLYTGLNFCWKNFTHFIFLSPFQSFTISRFPSNIHSKRNILIVSFRDFPYVASILAYSLVDSFGNLKNHRKYWTLHEFVCPPCTSGWENFGLKWSECTDGFSSLLASWGDWPRMIGWNGGWRQRPLGSPAGSKRVCYPDWPVPRGNLLVAAVQWSRLCCHNPSRASDGERIWQPEQHCNNEQ